MMEIKDRLLTVGAAHGRTGKPMEPKGIVVHYVGNAGSTAEANRSWFEGGAGGAHSSAHYIVGLKGEILRLIPDSERAQHAGKSYAPKYDEFAKTNNSRLLGIECCHPSADGKFSEATSKSLVGLCAELCLKYGFDPIKDIYRHYDVSGKMCPLWHAGHQSDWDSLKADVKREIADRKMDNAGKAASPEMSPEMSPEKTPIAGGSEVSASTQASSFRGLAAPDVAARVLALAKASAPGVLPSVKAAQMLLESGSMSSELALKANNCFGMKASLSGNTWPGSSWDGKGVYVKKTTENRPDGAAYTVEAEFRAYPCVEDSIADHTAYLLGARNGGALRYAGLAEAGDCRAQIGIIKNGGYATDVNYVQKVLAIIEKYGLDKFDGAATPLVEEVDEALAVKASALNVRAGAGTAHAVVGQLAKGEIVSASRLSGGWYLVSSGKVSGWASGEYLERLSVEDAVDKLAKEGVIADPGYWKANSGAVKNLDKLLIVLGNAAKKAAAADPVETAEAAISKLAELGAVDSPDYWMSNYSKMEWIGALLINAANRL
jgi:flagellum-specific peptidoglycan hydrolase FlgJ